jgi:2-(1,2-epoxy-1,2-dihydrophenyl)acetyl-CoA isomerase
MSEQSKVRYEATDGVATVTLHNPARKNAFDGPMLREVAAALDRAQGDDDVRVVVLTGAGDAFCAGGDVSEMGNATDPTARKTMLFEVVHAVPRALMRMDKPTIAMVNGIAVGAGLDMALACDLRFAADDARLVEGYIDVGLAAGDGGAYFLPRLVGTALAMELLFSGRPVRGEEAQRIGLVNRVVPREELAEHTYAFARQLAAKPPYALRMMKRLVRQSRELDFDSAMELSSSQVAILQCGQEHRDAVQAFRDRMAARR